MGNLAGNGPGGKPDNVESLRVDLSLRDYFEIILEFVTAYFE